MKRGTRVGLALCEVFWLAAAVLGCGQSELTRQHPRRIVALAPSSVEWLFALGLGGRVVGVGDYCTFPPEVEKLPRLGGLFDPNLEAIVALEPDLVVLLPSEDKLGGQLARLGIDSLTVGSDSLADVEAGVTAMAARNDVPAAGTELLARLRRELAPVASPTKLRVLISLEREPGRMSEILSAGPGSFVDELLTRAGAINLFADAGGPFPKVGLEAVLGRDPDLIIELATEKDPERDQQLLADWQAYPMLRAVSAGRLEVIAGTHTVVPGPRLMELYADLRRAIGRAGAVP